MNYMYLLNFFILNLLLIIIILVSLAFLTLLERNILGYIQYRKGPNKVLFKGVFQPFSDAIKLFSKEILMLKFSNHMFYLVSPLLMMVIMLMLWIILPNYFNIYYNDYDIMLFLCFLSMGVYSMMMSGWASNSLYSMLGCIRSIAQTISYEVSLIFIILSSFMLVESWSINNLLIFQNSFGFYMILWPIMLLFLISLIAELNRTPFDLAEGESELVSGFNVEYMSGSFALIFMSEYGMIMLMSMIFSIFYFGSDLNSLNLFIKVVIVMMIIIVFRGSFPRVRYDQLMMMIWKSFLPVILNLFLYLYFLKWFIYM
uniref:NADH-ubiquinone oxidoreductase chain 1 n=1 Tax=Aegilips sp. ZJUH 20220002 TaxID=2943451 RepID=A0A9E8GD46_9HYME|nr:NADH dehydrogenase subunit 1 [Aegilips sp. ZJUH 20220002]